MRARLLPLLVLLAPAASACSLGGPVPGPGEFVLLPQAGGEPWRVAVEGRMLGGMCELSNPHALDGDAFAWVEVDHLVGGAERDVLVAWRDGARVEHRGVTTRSIDAFAMEDGVLLLYARAWDTVGEGDARAFLRMDARTGATEELPFPRGDWASVAASGSVLAGVLRDEAAERATLHAYDAATGAWLLQGVDLASMDVPWHAGIFRMTETHALLAGQPAVLVDLRSGEARPTPAPGDWVLAMDAAWIYVQTAAGVERVSLEDGRREAVGTFDGALLSVQDGHFVTGRYATGNATEGPAPATAWVGRVALAAGLSVTLGVAATVWWRWRRAPP